MFLSGVRFELFREIGSYGDHLCLFSSFNHHLRICLLIFREKETLMWERNIDRVPPTHALTGHQTRSPRLCSDRESTPRCYGVRDNAASSRAPGRGLSDVLKLITVVTSGEAGEQNGTEIVFLLYSVILSLSFLPCFIWQNPQNSRQYISGKLF